MRKKRFFLLGNLIIILLLVFLLVGGVYAYWTNLHKNDSNVLVIGEGTELLLSAVALPEEGKVLVPTGNALADNEIDSVLLQYNVKLNQHTEQDLNLVVTAENILINNIADNSGLVNIQITNPDKINNSEVQVSVAVTLAEPESIETYNAIKNQTISFTLSFSAAAS